MDNEKKAILVQKLQALSMVVARAQLAGAMGQQYGGDRDLYQALGYPAVLTTKDFLVRYDRQDIARAVIDKPVDATWQGKLLLQEAKQEDTPIEGAWAKMMENAALSLQANFKRLDKLVGLGRYAVLLLGFSDVRTRDDFEKPVGGKPKLLYLQVFAEDDAPIKEFETSPTNPRYGLPTVYELKTVSAADANTTQVLRVHYTRLLHVAGESLDSQVYGMSRLRPIFNRLMDLEKLVGGSAEMFWRGARPGYTGKVDEDFTLSTEEAEELQNQLDEYEHNLRRFLINKGISVAPMDLQVADPAAHVDVQIQMISAQTGIPKRILTGSERGELASTQDQDAWYSLIQERRLNYAEPMILRPFISRCIELGILPPLKSTNASYTILWSPLFEQKDKDKAETGRLRAEAVKAYTTNPSAEEVIPPEAFYRYFLGFGEEQITLITEIKDSALKEEDLEEDPSEKKPKPGEKKKSPELEDEE